MATSLTFPPPGCARCHHASDEHGEPRDDFDPPMRSAPWSKIVDHRCRVPGCDCDALYCFIEGYPQ